MATKSTGSGRAPSLEAWNPNIKAPGITQRSGAYFRGDVYETPDYAAVNEAVMESMQTMAEEAGKFAKTRKDEIDISDSEFLDVLSSMEGKDQRAAMAKKEWDKMSKEERQAMKDEYGGLFSGRQRYIRNRKKNIIQTHPDNDLINDKNKDNNASIDATENNLYVSGENAFDQAARSLIPEGFNYNDLKRKDKKIVKQKLEKLSTIKGHLNEFWANYKNSDIADINFSAFNDHPDAKEFIRHLLTDKEGGGKGDFQVLFSENGINPVIAYTDRQGNKRTLSSSQLLVGKEMWRSNKEDKSALNDLINSNVDQIINDRKTFNQDRTQGEVVGGGQFDLETAIKDKIEVIKNTDPKNFNFIFNNMMEEKFPNLNSRFTKYDPNAVFIVGEEETEYESDVTMEQAVEMYLEERLMKGAGKGYNVKQKPVTTSGGGGGASEYSNNTLFGDIMDLSKATFKKNKWQPGDLLTDDVLPAAGKSVEGGIGKKLYDAWNKNSNVFTSGDLDKDELVKIVQHGIANNGSFKNWDDYPKASKRVFDVWQSEYGGSKGASVADDSPINAKRVEEIVQRGGGELNGKIIEEGATELDVNDNGDRIVTFFVQQGTEGLNPVSFNIDSDAGLKRLYIALNRSTDSNFETDSAEFNAMLEKFREQNK
jgi:hypothetical protein